MRYTREQRLDIAKLVYDGELAVEEAAEKLIKSIILSVKQGAYYIILNFG